MQQNNYEERKRFFQTLFKGTTGYIEIRTIEEKDKIKQFWFKTSELDRLLRELEKPHFKRANTYFGVCPRRTKKGTEKDVHQVNCLWVDLDAKNREQKRAIKTKLGDFDPEPSIIVSSGNGYHSYWLFDKLKEINTQEDIDLIKGFNKGLAEELRGDKGIDLSRILRVPGTKNLKNPKETLAVTIVKFEPHIRYSLKGQFLARFKRDIHNEIEKVEIDQNSMDNIPDRFWKILEENSKIRNTCQGKRKDLKDNTRSGYDMALANLLMPFGFTDSELISILKESESGKGKEAKPQYLIMTIGKAKATWEKRRKEKEKRLDDDRERFLSLEKEIPTKEKKEGKKLTRYQKKVEGAAKTFLTRGYNGYDLSQKQFKPEQFWISNGLLPKRGFVLLAAHKGRGKTTLTLQMCLKLIQGNTTFLKDFEIKESPRKILYCYAENEPAELKLIKQTQEGSIGIKLTKKQNQKLIFQPRTRLDLVDPAGIAVFGAALEILKPDIVIFDPVHRFLAGQDINKLQNINKFFDTLAAINKNCLWFFVSHLRKPSKQDTGSTIYKVMGSSAFVNNCDTVITLDRADPHRDPLCSLMEITTRRARLIQDTYIKLNEETRSLEVITKSDLHNKITATAEDIQADLREMGGVAEPVRIVEFSSRKYQVSRQRIYQLLTEAKDKGLISQEIVKGESRGQKYHVL